MNFKTLELLFASNTRSAGQRLYKEDRVSFSKPSAVEVISYVKPNYKVSLKLTSIQSPTLNAHCRCGPAQKGNLCKHIWAATLAVLEKSPDFFENVKEILPQTSKAPQQTEAQAQSSEVFKLKQENFKLRQQIYRKEQYQKQKERAKEFKSKKKSYTNQANEPSYPRAVQEALSYFSENGFTFDETLNEASILLARKKLSRIFHPDVGGSHSEILQLNSNSEVLLKFIQKI